MLLLRLLSASEAAALPSLLLPLTLERAAATAPRAQSGVRMRKSGGSALAPTSTDTLCFSSPVAIADTRARAETSARNAAPSEGLRSATRLTATAILLFFFSPPFPSSSGCCCKDRIAALTVEFGP